VSKKLSAMRWLYSLLLYLITPYLLARLWWRARRLPAYRQRIAERFGYYPAYYPSPMKSIKKCIWVHAVSVGETVVAEPIIQALIARYPDFSIVVTTMTPTGAARVKQVLGDSVIHAYLPYDFPGAVKRFLQTMQPQWGVIIETELWPNLLMTCQQRAIPMCLLNARLSARSARGYQRISTLTAAMLRSFAVIAAQSPADAKRLIDLGALPDRVQVTGNLKFDIEVSADVMSEAVRLRQILGQQRFIWIAASTHAGEEEIILAAHQLLRVSCPSALLILVPRHPDRFDAVMKLSEQTFATVRRSQQTQCTEETAVYLADTMGELILLYGVADVAFVGGSLVARGGHNLLEPAALAKPLLSGPHVFNFSDISARLNANQALGYVTDAASLAAQLRVFCDDADRREQWGERAKQVVMDNRGALKKQLEILMRITMR
jgi:3-deoxy-D-manno-octulosonic-acid transferase